MNSRPAAAHASVWFANLSSKDRAELTAGHGEIRHPIAEVLVVGGGLIGLSLTYFLAERGVRVQLIESQTLAGGASGANAGGIWPNDQGPAHTPAFQTLAFQGRDLWGRLSLRPEFDFDWRVNGFLNLNPERIGPSAEQTAARLQDEGYTVHAVDGEQIAALEPHLRPGFSQGLHLPSEAHLHPVKGVCSLARAARQRGAGIATGVSALGLSLRNGTHAIVTTTAGPIEARNVVAATGWSASWLAGTTIPLRPVSGQLIATEPLPPLLKSTVVGKYLVLQLQTGEIVTGGNSDESDRLSPDEALSAEFAEAARDLIPALRDVPFTRAWCGIRPGTPDGLPIIDRSAAAESLWLACGHFKNGVLLAPPTGKVLAEWIVSGQRPEALEPFRGDRFSPAG